MLYIDNCLIEAKEELSGSYEIAAGTRVIADWAFYDCSALTQVTIPSSVKSIGDFAFYWCSALAEMTVLATVPPTVIYSAFYEVSRDIPVYVPAESLEAYKAGSKGLERIHQLASHTVRQVILLFIPPEATRFPAVFFNQTSSPAGKIPSPQAAFLKLHYFFVPLQAILKYAPPQRRHIS